MSRKQTYDRLLMQRGSANALVSARMPASVASRITGAVPPIAHRLKWHLAIVDSSGRSIRSSGLTYGAERTPAVTNEHQRQHGFWASLGDRKHIDANFDRVDALRAPFDHGGWRQDWLLEMSSRSVGRSRGTVQFDLLRMSSSTPDTVSLAKERCPNGVREYVSGQGGGVLALKDTLQLACAARAEAYKVEINVKGDADRFIRTGVTPALVILSRAGIRVRFDGPVVDTPLTKEIDFRSSEHSSDVMMLQARLERHLREIFVAAELGMPPPGLPDFDHVVHLSGLSETLSCGAGLDFLLRDEATADGIGSRHQVLKLAQHPSYRRFAGIGGYWLVEPGYRHRRRLHGDPATGLVGSRFATKLRPIVLEKHENVCMQVLRARWPHADFLDPIVIKKAWLDPTKTRLLLHKPIDLLKGLKGETLVCVDHTMVHFGSVMDIDVMLRQQRCSLHAVLPSSWLHPRVGIDLLNLVPSIGADALRITRDIDGSTSEVSATEPRLDRYAYKVKKRRYVKPRHARVRRDKPPPGKMYPAMT